ncbi:MAG TPA: PDZ domain-containing protein [Pyrinomonadaceae bacterium]|nr:PDZ domain-containing protein [Pyrinomonadaceae bacterium]
MRVFKSNPSTAGARTSQSTPLALACLSLLFTPSAFARQTAPAPPPPATQAKPAAAVRPTQTPQTPRAPRATTSAPPQATQGSGRTPRAPQAPKAAPAAPAPKQLVTVVHRLSGWKLLTWLALTGPPMLELDRFPSANDVHTNIVAGFVAEDGKTVVARLPRAEALLETASAQPPNGYYSAVMQQQPTPSEFTLILGDGRRVDAKFVGLDASTGLSLLEAFEPLLKSAITGDEGHTEDPTVGQLVRLYAPAPLAEAAPKQNFGVVYFGIDQTEGRLTEVSRASTGKPFEVTAHASRVSPAWTGAVAMDETGALVGIVAESGPNQTRIVPAVTMRGAIDRVLAQRASVPQPWLGVRGDDVFKFSVQQWEEIGWKPELALPLIQSRQGVLLTSVAPGTPAASAGLRPGDVISRINGREVRGVGDLSPLLREAGVGQTVGFTVWRAFEKSPVELPVMLSGTRSPAISTAEAELKAARASLYALELELRTAYLAARNQQGANAAHLKELEARQRALRLQAETAEARMAQARRQANEPARPSFFEPKGTTVLRPLRALGLEVIGLTPRSAASLQAKGGVLVVSVAPDSPAAAGGLRTGDVIETLNGRSFSRLEIRKLLAEAGSAPLPVGVVREGQRLSLTLKLGPELR